MVVYPARTIESDSILVASSGRRVIDKNITYEESDIAKIPNAEQVHPRLYKRQHFRGGEGRRKV
jgi:hypothetical protein